MTISSINTFIFPYNEKFQPILNYHSEQPLKNLLNFERKKRLLSQLGFCIFSSTVFLTETDKEGLIHKFTHWNKFLEDELESLRYSSYLVKLQQIANRIFEENKILHLKERMEIENPEFPELVRQINRFDELIRRILTTPLIGDKGLTGIANINRFNICDKHRVMHSIKEDKIPLYGKLNRTMSLPDLRQIGDIAGAPVCELSCNLEHRYNFLKAKVQNRSIQLELDFIGEKLRRIVPEKWETELSAAFDKFTTKEEVSRISQKLLPRQAALLMHKYFIPEENWRLTYFISALPFSVLQIVLLSLENDQIAHLNAQFRKLAAPERAWLNEALCSIREDFIKQCNGKNMMLDQFTAKFSKDNNGKDITNTDINDLACLKDDIILSKKELEIVMEMFKGVVDEPLTRTRFKEVNREYDEQIQRLNDDTRHIPKVNGCVYRVIYKNVFKRNDVENRDEAIEIFPAWQIIDYHDYYFAGLLKEITEEQFMKLKEQGAVYTKAKENLKSFGIETIEDLKRLKIFNKNMLRQYIQRVHDKNEKNSTAIL